MQFWKQLRFSIFVLAFIAGLVLGYGQIKPPAAAMVLDESEITLDQVPQEASMQMLLSHIRNMAAVPHHVDSPGLQQTQAYLKAQILQMGFTYEEEKYSLSIEDIMVIDALRMENGGKDFHTSPESIRDNGDLGTRQQMALNNIIVTVDAPQTEEAVLFVAHTDSVKKGPGAFDDIVSVAAMLEGLRQLQDLTPVRDMVFLFTDGEEQGLLGAAKYVEDHPDMQAKTRLVINLEARGNRGGLLMFETSDNNLELVRSFASSAHHPISLSLATAVYRSMQNDTDFSISELPAIPASTLPS
ncbi:MAG: M20/M25/M40 family metallo-hydrolase [Tissierellia bacterium]|nr:M20/M25/M40 family metallo-hydrolase [Tissierellia bacterium]